VTAADEVTVADAQAIAAEAIAAEAIAEEATSEEAAESEPRVTISLVTFNGSRWMPGCIASVVAQTFDDFELLVLDNASSDDTVAKIEEVGDSRVAIERSTENLGYAAGHNRNIEKARGEFVLLLNQDVELDPEFIASVIPHFDADQGVGSVQARIRRLDGPGLRTDQLDTIGLAMNRDRRVISRGQGATDGAKYAETGIVFGVDGPAPVYRLSALFDAQEPSAGGGWEVLDEAFFMYKEDVDLAWRLHRLGWKTVYEPAALAWHGRGSGGPGAITMLEIARTNWQIARWVKTISWRNQRLMQAKNDRALDYLRDLPWIARRELLSWAFILVADPLRMAALPGLVRALPDTLRKRRFLARRFRGRARGHADTNELFDATWYGERYPELRDAGLATYEHYRLRGIDEGCDPNPLFDTDWYLEHNADVRDAGANPLEHYLEFGGFEGRDPHPLFKSDWYLVRYPDVAQGGVNPLLHYLRYGVREGRLTNPTGDARALLDGWSLPGRSLVELAWDRGSRTSRRLSAGSPARARLDEVFLRAWDRVRALTVEAVPAGARLAVITDGDDRLLDLPGLDAQPFPPPLPDLAPVGVRSATGGIASLEAARATGTEFLVVPLSSSSPRSYPRFERHLARYPRVVNDDAGAVYDLRSHDPAVAAAQQGVVLEVVDRFRRTTGREPTILDWSGWADEQQAGAVIELNLFAPPDPAADRLPYTAKSIDLVLVRDGSEREAEGRRVARAAVVCVPQASGGGGRRGSADWLSSQSDRLPGATVIIPTYNRLSLVRACLTALVEHTEPELDLQIVVIDDASSDGSTAELREVVRAIPRAILIENETNLGFVGAVNRAAEAATGDVLVLLNNDTVPLPGWLTPLLRTLRDHEDVGVVGGRLVYPDGRLQEAGGIVFSDASGANFGSGRLDPDAPEFTYVRDVDYVSGALLATRRALFEELGGLDRIWGFGYYDDSDYSFKLRERGLRTVFQPDSVVVHIEGGTAGTDTSTGPKESQVRNRSVFVERWAMALHEQPYPPETGWFGDRARPVDEAQP
jgi:GT2 family glycosyltransferase